MLKPSFLTRVQLLLFCAGVFFAGFLSAEEWVVPVPDWDRPPYSYVDQSGQLQGIDIAILTEIGRRANINMVMKSYSFAQRQTNFINGTLVIDCCLTKEWRQTTEDIAVQLFSEPIYSGVDVFLFPPGMAFDISDNLQELNDKVVGGMRGYTYVNQEQYGSRLDHDNQEAMLASVNSGRVDVGILERHVAAYYSKKLGLPVEFGPIQHSVNVGIRLHKSKHQFMPAINRVIAELVEEGYIKRIIRQEARKANNLLSH